MKIVVAYSGGLDTSVILNWLKQKYNAEVIAYCADVGQGEELDGLEEKALKTGASKCYIGDLKEDFAENFIFPMFQGNALYEGRYLLGTSIARPCIMKGLMEVAIKEGADAAVAKLNPVTYTVLLVREMMTGVSEGGISIILSLGIICVFVLVMVGLASYVFTREVNKPF